MESRKSSPGITLAWLIVVAALGTGMVSPAGANHLLTPTDGIVDSRCDNHSCTQVRLDDDVAEGGNLNNRLDTAPADAPPPPPAGLPDRLTWGGKSVCVEDFVAPGCAAGGDITDIIAGAGLAGGATFGSASLSLADGGVTASRLADGSVVESKLADGSVTTAKVLDETLTDADVSAAAGIGWSKVSKAGSSLSDLATRSASDLSSGTLGDARLSGNVALLGGAQTFTGTKTFGATTSFAGNVGIGTTSPVEKLHLGAGGKIAVQAPNGASYGTIDWDNSAQFNFKGDDGSSKPVIASAFGSPTGGSAVGMTFPSSTTVQLGVNGNAITIDNSHRVGIGTASPAGKLDVAGSLCISGDCRTSWPSGPTWHLEATTTASGTEKAAMNMPGLCTSGICQGALFLLNNGIYESVLSFNYRQQNNNRWLSFWQTSNSGPLVNGDGVTNSIAAIPPGSNCVLYDDDAAVESSATQWSFEDLHTSYSCELWLLY